MEHFELISFAGADELAARVAAMWLDEIDAARRAGKPHCVALSGGRITQKFFTSVVKLIREGRHVGDPDFRDGGTPSLPSNVHFFWADERCVPAADPESNFRMARELLFAPLKIPESRIHRIRGEEPPERAAKMASEEMLRVVPKDKNGLPMLDLIFLGMGEDGHVASLFPGRTEGADPEEIFCAVKNSPKPPPDRVSLTYAAIAAAKQVWVMASGAGKEAALRESIGISGRTPLAKVLHSHAHVKIMSDIALKHL